MPIFTQVNVVSANLTASIEFYRRLGLEIAEGSIWRTKTGVHHASVASPGHSTLDLELDSADFARIWNSGWRGHSDLRGRIIIGFQVAHRDIVDERYAELTGAGYVGLQVPYDAFWGARYAIVEGPDGIAIGIMSPVLPEFKRAPPDL